MRSLIAKMPAALPGISDDDGDSSYRKKLVYSSLKRLVEGSRE